MRQQIRKLSTQWGGRFARARALVGDFRVDGRGNVAVICAVSAIPIVAAIGCVIDYSNAAMLRTKLQAAADAATLAAVSANSTLITTAKSMTTNGSVSGGSTAVLNFFNADLASTTGYTNPSSTAGVTKSGMVINATLSYTAQVPTFFLGVIGYKNIAISGGSTASYTLPTYIDFYLMLDVSGSMGFPSTTAEQTRLQGVNPDNNSLYPNGCTFACHFLAQGACPQSEQGQSNSANNPQPGQKMSAAGYIPNPSPGGYCQGYIVSRLGTTPATGNGPFLTNWSNTPVTYCQTPGTTACIQLRLDAVGYAVNQLLQTAAASEQVTNQFRVGLYPFIQYLYSYFPLTTSLSGSATNHSTINYAATQLATLLDSGQNSNLGSGGTHFENAFPSMNNLITSVGTGTSTSNTLPYVFLITDGSQDNQTQWSGNWSGSNSATTINTALCTTLKNRGITIAILYIPYEPIQNPTTFANSEDIYANNNIPNIPPALQACASPNFFYTANTPTDITNALITMFEQAVSTAHITN